MLIKESGLRAMSNQLLMNLFDGTESIVLEQQKVGTSAGLNHAMQEHFAHTELLCLHSVTHDVLLFEQVVFQNSVFAR